MAKMKGLCRNEECEMCDKIQEAEKSNFVCEKCGHKLIPFGDKQQGSGWMKEHGRLVAIIIAAVVVIAGGIFGGMTLFSDKGDGATPPEPPLVEQNDSVKVDSTAVADTLKTSEKVADTDKQVEEPTETKPVRVTTPRTTAPQPKNGYGKVDLGYGIYEGDLKDGQPHGHGIITYSRRHQIVSSKDFMANPGDRFEGDFREGRISSIGYWYHDGEQTAIKP